MNLSVAKDRDSLNHNLTEDLTICTFYNWNLCNHLAVNSKKVFDYCPVQTKTCVKDGVERGIKLDATDDGALNLHRFFNI